jgi:cobyrinic acid a,c-diamide synthase
MLYLMEAGILPGKVTMHPRLKGLGYQSAPLPGLGTLRGHTFHYSTLETSLTPWARGERLFNTSPGEAIYKEGKLIASYLHSYFPSNPQVVARLFQS